ncbi:MAG: hypothetical protein HC869_01075 [Rhodospirillales bacterium]|nr:hypothetical protein [Rhodospirillales bacterium]
MQGVEYKVGVRASGGVQESFRFDRGFELREGGEFESDTQAIFIRECADLAEDVERGGAVFTVDVHGRAFGAQFSPAPKSGAIGVWRGISVHRKVLEIMHGHAGRDATFADRRNILAALNARKQRTRPFGN